MLCIGWGCISEGKQQNVLGTPETHDTSFYSLPVGQNLTVTVTAVDDGVEVVNESLVEFVNEDAVLWE